MAYSYAPGRGYHHAEALLGGYRGIVQCAGYDAYKKLVRPMANEQGVTLAFCWSHVRRGFYDLAKTNTAPIATEALKRMGALYEVEALKLTRLVNGRPQNRLDELLPWLWAPPNPH